MRYPLTCFASAICTLSIGTLAQTPLEQAPPGQDGIHLEASGAAIHQAFGAGHTDGVTRAAGPDY